MQRHVRRLIDISGVNLFNLQALPMRFFNTLIFSDRWSVRLLRHALFWLADMFNWLMVISIGRALTRTDAYFFLMTAPIAMIATYIILYVFVPRFSTSDRGRTMVWIVVTLFLMGLALRAYKFYVVIPLLNWDPIHPAQLWDLGAIIGEVFKWMAVICMAVALKLIKSKSELQRRNEQLLAEKRTAELSFLKLQMNPHFLFNTLNTLYSETLQHSPKAEEVVMHLSNLMRFILEECNQTLIPLQKELKVIDDYIALEKLRHGARLVVNVTVPRITEQVVISPLLFLPFVENSFKHSLNHVRGVIHITIHVSIANGQLRLRVENDHDRSATKNHSTGVGISNIKQQLELLYGTNYSLAIDDSGEKYMVELRIPVQNPRSL